MTKIQKKLVVKDPLPQQQPNNNNGNNSNGNKSAAAVPNKATGVGTDEAVPKRLKLVCNLSEFGTKTKKKEEPVSNGFQVGSERFHHTMAALGELIGQVLHRMHNGKPGCMKPIETTFV
jgi:hypothetical protein